MWFVEMAREAGTAEYLLTKFARLGVQIAHAGAAMCARLGRGSATAYFRTENDSASHTN